MSNPIIPLRLSLPISPVGIQLWLAADAIEEPDGTLIGSWGDLSFNASAARQDNSSFRPQLKLAQLNGLPVVIFDIVNDCLQLGGRNGLYFDKTQPISIFAVMKIASTAMPPVMVISKRDPVGVYGGFYFLISANPSSSPPVSISYNFRGINLGLTKKLATLPQGILTNWHALGCTYDGSLGSAGISLYQDGVLITAGLSVQDTICDTIKSPFAPAIGTQTGDNDGGTGLSLAELLLFTRKLSTSEITALEQYFQQKWGVP